MKKIEAIIRISKLEEVKNALVAQGVEGMTITEVHGRGHAKPREYTYRGVTETASIVPRIKIETVVSDDEAERTIDSIFQAANTGEVGDGRILVVDLESVTRIRTGETFDRDADAPAHGGASQ